MAVTKFDYAHLVSCLTCLSHKNLMSNVILSIIKILLSIKLIQINSKLLISMPGFMHLVAYNLYVI